MFLEDHVCQEMLQDFSKGGVDASSLYLGLIFAFFLPDNAGMSASC